MVPSPSLPPTGRPHSSVREVEMDLPRGRSNVVLRKLDVLPNVRLERRD